MKYDVLLIPQTTSMGCWAASIAMILAWKSHACFDPGSIAANPGGLNYEPSMATGLDPNDRYILRRNGFEIEPMQCYSLDQVRHMLTDFGPLWVASAAPGPHIRVVAGFQGDMLYVNDPWPVNRGRKYISNFNSVFGAMEQLGAEERSEPNPVYVAYLAQSN